MTGMDETEPRIGSQTAWAVDAEEARTTDAELRAAMLPSGATGMEPALIEQLIREVVEIAEYGLGRDGCPFCSGVSRHADGTGPKPEPCIAKLFGARDYVGDVHPEQQPRGDRG